MELYFVSQRINLMAGEKVYRPGRQFRREDIPEANFNRWLDKKFIKPLADYIPGDNEEHEDNGADGRELEEESTSNDGNPSEYEQAPVHNAYLSADEINAMEKEALIAYAQRIGAPDLGDSPRIDTLRKQVLAFIENLQGDAGNA